MLDRGSFDALTCRVEKVNVPEIGDSCYLRVMTARERDAYDMSQGDPLTRKVNLEHITARLLVRCLCDEEGERLYADDELDQIGNMPSTVTEPLFNECRRINGMTAAAVEDAVKNSEATPGDSSSTG